MGCYIESNGLDTAHLLPRSYHCCHKRRHPMAVAELKDWWTSQSPVHTSGCSCLSVSSRRNCVPGGGGAAAAPWSGRSMTHSAPSLPPCGRSVTRWCAFLRCARPVSAAVIECPSVGPCGGWWPVRYHAGRPGTARSGPHGPDGSCSGVERRAGRAVSGGRGTSTAPGRQAAAVGSRGGETAM